MPELYAEIEARTKQALHNLHACGNPNITAVAREFQVPMTRLRARWNGVHRNRTCPGSTTIKSWRCVYIYGVWIQFESQLLFRWSPVVPIPSLNGVMIRRRQARTLQSHHLR